MTESRLYEDVTPLFDKAEIEPEIRTSSSGAAILPSGG
jgi:hypothetical protein